MMLNIVNAANADGQLKRPVYDSIADKTDFRTSLGNCRDKMNSIVVSILELYDLYSYI